VTIFCNDYELILESLTIIPEVKLMANRPVQKVEVLMVVLVYSVGSLFAERSNLSARVRM
jgi:hypothetical protein